MLTNISEETYQKIEDLIKLVHRKSYNFKLPEYIEFKAQKPELAKPLILDILLYIEEKGILIPKPKGQGYLNLMATAITFLGDLMRRNQNYTEQEWIEFVSKLRTCIDHLDKSVNKGFFFITDFPIGYTVQQIERYLKRNELSEELKNCINEMMDWNDWGKFGSYGNPTSVAKSLKKLNILVQGFKTSKLNTKNTKIDAKKIINDIYNEREIEYSRCDNKFKELKNKDAETKKILLIDVMSYIQDLATKPSHKVFRHQNIAFEIISSLLRKNLNYTETEWITYWNTVKETIVIHNAEIDRMDRFYYSDFGIHLLVKQLENHLKNNLLTQNLNLFIENLLNWEDFKTIRKINGMGYSTNKGPILNSFKKLYDILNTNSEEKKSKMIVKTELSREKFKEIDELIQSINKIAVYTIWTANDLADNIYYEEVKNKKTEFIKPFLIDLLLYLEEVEIIGRNGELLVYGEFSDTRRTSLAILGGLMRKNQNYNEEEWIQLLKQIHTSLLNINKKAIEPIYYTNFPIGYVATQLERYLKKNKASNKLKPFIKEILNWDNLKDVGYFDDKNKIPKFIKKLHIISQTINSEEKPTGKSKIMNTKTKLSEEEFNEIDKLIRSIRDNHSDFTYTNSTYYKTLKDKKIDYLKPFLIDLILYLEKLEGRNNKRDVALSVMGGLMRKNLNYNEEEWIHFFSQLRASLIYINKNTSQNIYYADFPIGYGVTQLERYIKKNEPSETLKIFIAELLNWDNLKEVGYYGNKDTVPKAIKKLQAIIQDENTIIYYKFKTEDIGNQVNDIVEKSNIYDTKELHNLLIIADTVSGGKPAQKFIKEVEQNIKTLGRDNYRKVAQDILEVIANLEFYEGTDDWGGTHTKYLCDPSKQFAKGLVWTMESFSDKKTVELLSKILEKSYTKVPGVGPVAVAVGNACAYTLGNMRGKDGLGALSRLKLKLKQNNIKKTIDKYLVEGAKKYNVSVEELKEMAVPDYHLVDGKKTIDFADYKLEVFIENSKIVQQWIKPDGNTMKSVPSVVKNEGKLTEKLKEIRKEIKEIQKTYSAQKQRIDNQFILNRTWDYPSFDKFYLSHGLVSPISKSMIFTFVKDKQKASGIFFNGKWENEKGEPIDWIDEKSSVSLWHPVFATESEIVSWRDRIMDLECKQPIKQAFRELYILTDAELNTVSYSNRMAAHILKQHQFKTLATLRDWKFSLMGWYDDGRDNETCEKYLPEYEMTAEYWIDELAEDSEDAHNDAGIWYHVATDQVKFKDKDGNVLNLIDVPKIVFSEVMRDVDLFVGVSSVGNDPEWQDNNGDRQNNYWRAYSFGDLTEIAKTRKAILERLLPRLTKINKKAHIDGKFLIVKGDLRTYKIHIGSGNILMEPNDQYLCIVPARNSEKSTDKLFIPFDGDKGLSIVLSKAFLLAEDTKITDSTIISQIGR